MKRLLLITFVFNSLNCFSQSLITSLGLHANQIIAANPVQDQSMSSTCWSFASNSFIESELMKHSKHPVKLSEMFIARYSYINKVYQFLAQKGGIFFTPGGQFHDLIKVVKEHGMVPEEVYRGKSGTGGYIYNHEDLDTAMHRFVEKLLSDGKLKPNASDLVIINQILDRYIGPVPSTFKYNGKEYTPVSFTHNFLHFNPADYIEITSYTHHPPFTWFVLEDKYNWTLDKYYNVPFTDFMTITDSCLAKGYSVCWDGDVDEPGFKFEDGIAYLSGTHTNLATERQTTFEDKSTSLDHMMHVIGTATDKNNNRWYYVKNSWGSFTNPYGGFLFMQREYFAIKTVAIIVNKSAIPSDIRKKMKL